MSRFVWDKTAEAWVDAMTFYSNRPAVAVSDLASPMVMGDLKDYVSVIDKSVITGRRQHRDHLRAHGCIEVGNEYIAPKRQELSKSDRVRDIKRSMGA